MSDESMSNGFTGETSENPQSMNEKREMVAEMLSNMTFREELKEMVVEQLMMSSAQPLAELLTLKQRFSSADYYIPGDDSVIPVCDIRGVDSLNYSKGEKLFRCKVAAFHRLVDIFGWADASQSYITARMSSETDFFLIKPDAIWYNEVTAANLVKVDLDGQILDPGSAGLGVDDVSFCLHSKFHGLRSDISCVVELTCAPAVSLSVMKCGLLALCPEAMALGEVTYLDFSDSLSIEEELGRLKVNSDSKVLVLHNFGVFVIAETVEEAFYLTYNLMSAIEAQLSLVPLGLDNLHVLPTECCQVVTEMTWQPAISNAGRSTRERGELEFEMMMRQLDGAGYCTGFTHREWLSHISGAARPRRAASDAGLAQSGMRLSAFGGSDRDLAKFGSPFKTAPRAMRALTPNIYYKEESENKFQPNTKIVKTLLCQAEAKWLSESAPSKSPAAAAAAAAAAKVTDKPNQFAPQGINPAELKAKVKAIRQDYYSDRVSAGPQSRILDGIAWDEAKFTKDGHVSGTSDAMVTMAASKGIIQREHQRHAVGFKKFDAPNPFNRMSEEDIETYKQEVEKRTMTSSVERLAREDSVEPAPGGRLISTEERLKTVRGEVGKEDKADQKEAC